ncbi:MAG: hypothetical protein P8R54_16570 [Myxococcota bacterium]|nr:hypothetical protein [Myxococcota bacterium]
MLALLLAVGCSGAPSLTERWRADPDRVAAEVAALPPTEQLAAVESILLTDPAGVGRLCGSLPEGDARLRCRTVQTRPHLWRGDAVPPPALPSPLADTPPSTGRCDDLDNPTVCWSRHAAGRASAGDAQGAAAGCHAIAAGQWRAECMFQSAETLLESRGPDLYSDAVSLCALSGAFVTDCLEHGVAQLAGRAPATPGGDWQPIRAAAEMITAHWQDIAPRQGRQQREALWALASALVYVEAPTVSSAPLAVLPLEAHPHIRAAMAWRLLHLSSSADLSTLTARLADAPSADSMPPVRQPRALVGLLDTWGEAVPPETATTTTWMGISTRVVSTEATVDGTIALLEAAARQPGQDHLIKQALAHADPLVVWTAQRLRDPQR